MWLCKSSMVLHHSREVTKSMQGCDHLRWKKARRCHKTLKLSSRIEVFSNVSNFFFQLNQICWRWTFDFDFEPITKLHSSENLKKSRALHQSEWERRIIFKVHLSHEIFGNFCSIASELFFNSLHRNLFCGCEKIKKAFLPLSQTILHLRKALFGNFSCKPDGTMKRQLRQK